MALFFAGSREGARDVGIYQSFFVRDSRVSFLAKNGDCCGESAVTYAKVCALDSPCKAPFLSQKSCREQVALESSHSTTATTRIYEESRASLRDTAEAVARQSTLESSAQVDSMDCHADKSARNDKNNAEILKTPQAAGFADDFVGCRAQSKGAYLSYVTAALRDDSRKSAAKPTPNPSQTQSPQKWTPPREILTPALLSHLSGKFIAKLGNPVSFVDSRGRVHLFVVGVSLGGWATSRVYWLEFDKTLEHLHFRQELALSPFANLSFLVRSSALLLEDGGFILPLYHELARKYPLLLHFDPALKLDSITKPLPTIGAKEHSKLQPSFAPLSATKAIGVYRSYTPSTMQVSLCELAPLSKPKQLRCQPPKTSNLINYNSSSVLFSTNGIVFLLHNTPPQIASHTKLESSAPESSTLDSSLPHAREQLWLFALVPESLEKERVEFVPLALLDSVESSEVSYPSVALSLDQVHIAYTYKRAYIKSLVLSKSALVRQAQEVLKRETQAESSSLPFALDSSAQARLPRLKKVRDD